MELPCASYSQNVVTHICVNSLRYNSLFAGVICYIFSVLSRSNPPEVSVCLLFFFCFYVRIVIFIICFNVMISLLFLYLS